MEQVRTNPLALLLSAGTLVGCGLDSITSTTASAPPSAAQIEPNAGNWKTWLLTSGKQMRLPAPPDSAAGQAEIKELQALKAQRDAKALDSIAYWDTGAPSHRWNEITLNQALKNNLNSNIALRDLALVHAAIYDALIAAWDSKYAYNRQRPSVVDPTLSTVVPNAASPSYPSEHAVAAGAASTVLAYIFPNDAKLFNDMAEEVGRPKLMLRESTCWQ